MKKFADCRLRISDWLLSLRANRQLGMVSARKIVGCVEIDLGAADFVSLEYAEWWRVDVNCDQILATHVGISQLMDIGDGSVGNLAGTILSS